MIALCIFKQINDIKLSDVADIAQVIIALINVGLAIYIFVYQKSQNLKTELKTSEQNEQNIKLHWFKELIIQPNFNHLNSFFENLEKIKEKINSDNLNESQIVEINSFIKFEAKKFRQNFNDCILNIDDSLYKEIKSKIEELVTTLTIVISDDEHKFTNNKTVEREILEPIRYCKNDIISLIFKYKGK